MEAILTVASVYAHSGSWFRNVNLHEFDITSHFLQVCAIFMTNICYAGENRNRENWGCRATSIALGDLINQVGTISACVNGKEIGPWSMTPVPFSGKMPAKVFRHLKGILGGPRTLRLSEFLNIPNDFIRSSPTQSVEAFLKIRLRFPHLNTIYNSVLEADCIVINGEGSYIFTTPPRRDSQFFNFLIELGTKLGKKVFLLNAMFSDCPRSLRNQEELSLTLAQLEKCSLVTVRDKVSLAFLREVYSSNNLRFFPDALFTWSSSMESLKQSVLGDIQRFEAFGTEAFNLNLSFSLSDPYIVLSGSSSAAWDPLTAQASYSSLATKLQETGYPLLIVPTCGGDWFLKKVACDLKIPFLPVDTPIRIGAAILAKAQVFVSGRFHPSIMASCGGTPCVFLGSNSHKTLSLQQLLEYDNPREFPALPDENDCEDILAATKEAFETRSRNRIQLASQNRGDEARKLIVAVKEKL